MATTLDDIAARLDRLESMLLQAGLAESIELMKSLSGRKGHARL
jgi:hypothetical protein